MGSCVARSLKKTSAMLLVALSCGCRFGYEILDDSSINAGTGGAPSGDGDLGSSGGSSDAGSGGNDAGSGGAAGSTGGNEQQGSGGDTTGSGGSSYGPADYVVETGEDTLGGALLSLRDAILLSNAGAGGEVISLGGNTVALENPLPSITQGVTIIGEGGSIDATSAGSGGCLYIDASDVTLDGVEFHDCAGEPILFSGGTGGGLINCSFHDNQDALLVFTDGFVVRDTVFEASGGTALAIHGSGSSVIDSTFLDSGFRGIFVDSNADGVVIVGNLVARSVSTAIFISNVSDVTIWHNTVVESGDVGIMASGSAIDLRNNVITHGQAAAVFGSDGDFAQFDYNLVFANTGPACTGCTTLPGPNMVTSDPDYVDFGVTYTISTTSPAVDQGALVTTDRNGASSGDFDGAGFDIGHTEVQ